MTARTAIERRYDAARTRSYRRRRAAGQTATVDAAVVRSHVEALREQGVTLRRIAAVSGVTRPTLYALMVGQPSKGLPPTRRVTHGVAQRVLAVTVQDAALPVPDLDTLSDLARVNAVGPRRRVHALVALGWSMQQCADRLGIARRQLQDVLLVGDQVSARTARAIRDLYDALCWSTPPTSTRWQRSAVTRSRALARARGWAPPLAWDDDSIDDPAAVPDLGAAPLSVVDLGDDEHLRLSGVPDEQIAARMGVSLDGLQTARRRARSREAAQGAELVAAGGSGRRGEQ